MKLAKEEFDNELHYLISKYVLKEMVSFSLVSKEQYFLIKKELLEIYQPLINLLYEEEWYACWDIKW